MSRPLTAVLVFSLLAVLAGLASASATIADAKLKADGEQVSLIGKAVTWADAAVLYVEEDNRACGLRIEKTSHGLQPGMRADLSGIMSTNSDGERYVAATQVSRSGTSTAPIRPLCISGRALGGYDWHCSSGSTAGQKGVKSGLGLNSIGMLVRISGRVTYKDTSGAFAYIDDGSAPLDGNALGPSGMPVRGVRVILSGMAITSAGSYATLTGISSTARVGGSIVRALRLPPSNYSGEMVLIPAGSFLMGASGIGPDANGYAHEKPQHSVYLSAYSIGKHEVTRGEYRRFLDGGGYSNSAYWSDAGWAWKVSANRTQPENWDAVQYLCDPPGPFTQTDNHPAAGVCYYEADAFCKWAGGHLPTEAQWEKAARWDGSPRVYPWGNTYDGAKCNADDDALYPGCQTAPTGSYPSGASPYGCLDMAANVFEWVQDWYSAAYYSQTPSGGWVDPQGPSTGQYRVLRGGCWYGGYDSSRCAYRDYSYPDHVCFGWLNAGFRVAR